MEGVDNRSFENEEGGEKSAVLDLGKDVHTKINKAGKVKIPRRVIHCSDGVYEEYSTDEEEEEPQSIVDPKTMTWAPYMWYLTTKTAFGGLAVCDYLGEKLAWFFGITSPRYQYAIDEVKRMQEEQQEQEEQDREEREAELKIVQSKQSSKNANYGTTTLTAKTSSPLDTDDISFTEKATED